MKYDFDRVITRTNTDSVKWMGTKEVFGVKAVLPPWVADTDFESPPPVVQALVERAQHGIFGYPRQSEAFSDAISGWMHRRQMPSNRQQMCATADVFRAVSLKPGDTAEARSTNNLMAS